MVENASLNDQTVREPDPSARQRAATGRNSATSHEMGAVAQGILSTKTPTMLAEAVRASTSTIGMLNSVLANADMEKLFASTRIRVPDIAPSMVATLNSALSGLTTKSLPKINLTGLDVNRLFPNMSVNVPTAIGLSAGQHEMARIASQSVRSLLESPTIASLNSAGLSASHILARVHALDVSISRPSSSSPTGFAGLQSRLSETPELAAEVSAFAEAAATRGPLGPRIRELNERVERVDDMLAASPRIREGLEGPLADIDELTGTSSWDLIDLSAGLGIYHHIQANGIALVSAVTLGVGRFVVGTTNGDSPEMTLWDAVATGAFVYQWVTSRRSSSDDKG